MPPTSDSAADEQAAAAAAEAPQPFAPQPGPGETAFRLERWQRAGADEDEVRALRDHHSTLAPNQRASEAAQIDATSDNELTEVLDNMRRAGSLTALVMAPRPGTDAGAAAAAERQAEVDAERAAAERQAEAEAEAARVAAERAQAAPGAPGAQGGTGGKTGAGPAGEQPQQ